MPVVTAERACDAVHLRQQNTRVGLAELLHERTAERLAHGELTTELANERALPHCQQRSRALVVDLEHDAGPRDVTVSKKNETCA